MWRLLPARCAPIAAAGKQKATGTASIAAANAITAGALTLACGTDIDPEL